MVRNLITDRKHRDICQKLHALDQKTQNIKNEWLANMITFQKHAKWLRILIRQQEKCNSYQHYKSVKLRQKAQESGQPMPDAEVAEKELQQ